MEFFQTLEPTQQFFVLGGVVVVLAILGGLVKIKSCKTKKAKAAKAEEEK